MINNLTIAFLNKYKLYWHQERDNQLILQVIYDNSAMLVLAHPHMHYSMDGLYVC